MSVNFLQVVEEKIGYIRVDRLVGRRLWSLNKESDIQAQFLLDNQ